MKSKVYYISVKNLEDDNSLKSKFELLLDKSGILKPIPDSISSVIKIHFGEEGNTGFIKPGFVKILAEKLINKKINSKLSDSNTLYKGRRTNSGDHTNLAMEHGFSLDSTLCKIEIPEDKIKENTITIPLNGNFIKNAHVLKLYKETPFIIAMSHFKGHIMTGFGGSLKNIGMGCASREGKLAQHSDLSPVIYKDNCTGCGECIKVCPVNAITEGEDSKALIDSSLCIGCATCLAACNFHAIDVNWASGGDTIQEKMIEYAKAVLDKIPHKLFINFCTKITKECDCLAKDDPRIVPDLGLFISSDPVSIDKACYDLICKNAGKDVFKEHHPQRDGHKQLNHASLLGLGNLEYELVEISAN